MLSNRNFQGSHNSLSANVTGNTLTKSECGKMFNNNNKKVYLSHLEDTGLADFSAYLEKLQPKFFFPSH